MTKAIVRNTRFLALSGVAAIAFGIIALVWPGITFIALLALFGAFAFVTGGFSLATGLNLVAERQTTWVAPVLGGLAGIAVGAVTFLWPGLTGLALVYLIGCWAIITGVFEFVAAIDMIGEKKGDWMLTLSGLMSIAFGTLVALFPRSGAMAVIWLIGLFAIASGATKLVGAYRLNKVESAVKTTIQHATGAA